MNAATRKATKIADKPAKASHPRIIRDAAFAKRLETALDGNPHVPAYNRGRLTWIRDQFLERFKQKLSTETARKWTAGESRPRPSKMKLLARLLEVDEAWLSLGIAPEMDIRAREKRNVALSGAANVLIGMVQLDGGVVAFPNEKDPRGNYVDAYVIIKGAQYAMHASLAQVTDAGGYKFTVPADYENCTVIGVVKLAGLRCDFIELPAALIDKHRSRKGGFNEIEVLKRGDEYSIGADKLPKIKSFAERL